ncbi:hypothetical protein EYF80_065654 [Liparis tanakae]|uniref:Uncharacterized protein n=1 Tax=Liparis tanakae TaxID=230148 RepID=A0A4Z2E6K9_9TELE|nr:hypothetical protein EYF80_065654 [Liparis tanakae]
MESSERKWREEVYFPPGLRARDSHHGSVLNSSHFITQTKIEDVNLIGTKAPEIKGRAAAAGILLQRRLAAEEITVLELCGSWASSLDPSDIQVAVFK